MIETSYIPAVAALFGTFIGGLTSMVTTWIGQSQQAKGKHVLRSKSQRQELYRQFVQEGSKLHLHALEHDTANIADLANIYAIMNEIRIFASSKVIEEAEKAVKVIIDTYRQKNKDFKEVIDDVNTGFPNPLRAFSEACHHELNR